MSYAVVGIIVAAVMVVSGALSWLVRRRVNLDALRRHHEVGSAVFLQLGVVYAVLLAFVFIQVWGQYNEAANAIDQECGALHGAAILAATLHQPMRHAILSAEAAYLRDVVDKEWPAMRRGEESVVTRRQFEAMLTEAAAPVPQGRALAARVQILSLLTRAHAFRETRMFQASLAVPTIFWVLLVAFGLVLTGFLLCFGMANIWSQVAFTAVFAGLIAFVLLLVALMDFPFGGALGLRPGDFQRTLHNVQLLHPDAV